MVGNRRNKKHIRNSQKTKQMEMRQSINYKRVILDERYKTDIKHKSRSRKHISLPPTEKEKEMQYLTKK
jgi:hypothetical protein